jgi:hypothetical protein
VDLKVFKRRIKFRVGLMPLKKDSPALSRTENWRHDEKSKEEEDIHIQIWNIQAWKFRLDLKVFRRRINKQF